MTSHVSFLQPQRRRSEESQGINSSGRRELWPLLQPFQQLQQPSTEILLQSSLSHHNDHAVHSDSSVAVLHASSVDSLETSRGARQSPSCLQQHLSTSTSPSSRASATAHFLPGTGQSNDPSSGAIPGPGIALAAGKFLNVPLRGLTNGILNNICGENQNVSFARLWYA